MCMCVRYVAIGSPGTTHTYTRYCHSSLCTRIASLSEEDEASIQSGKVCSSEWSQKKSHLECNFRLTL